MQESAVRQPPPQSSFILKADDGAELFVYRWAPSASAKAVVQIVHGLAEHGARYARLAKALVGQGYGVYANDHRGHGRTVKTSEQLGFLAERDGWRKCIDDLWLLNRRIAADHPRGAPVILLGHSMGSTMARQFITEHGEVLAGVALSGPNGQPPAMALLGRIIANLERVRLGRRGHSRLIQDLTFGAFNKAFAPVRTPFDWLSRDPVEVEKYIADPLCGFPASVQLWIDLLGAWKRVSTKAAYARVPHDLPLLVMAGQHDPVSAGSRQIAPMLEEYRTAGLHDVEAHIYPDARHEIFNEINRDQVTDDLMAWLKRVTTR